jgi:hypothetical protein
MNSVSHEICATCIQGAYHKLMPERSARKKEIKDIDGDTDV